VGPAGIRRRPENRVANADRGPDAAFLDRFLAARGAGPHHFNFLVTDIEDALARIKACGIEPVGVNLADPGWKEAFIHPRDAHGIVVQVAQQAGPPPASAPPSGLPEPGLPSRLDLIEHHVGDLDGAVRLFRDVLDGRLDVSAAGVAELTWPGGKRIRLVGKDGLPLGGALSHIRFSRPPGSYSIRDRDRAGLLASQLGLSVELAD